MLAIEHSNRIPVVTDQPTMILGMDVSHGSPGRSDVPSIAAVTILPIELLTVLWHDLLYA